MNPDTVPTRGEIDAFTHRILELTEGANAEVTMLSSVKSSTVFARGETHVADQVARTFVQLTMEIGGRYGGATTDQLDDDGLRVLVAEAEAMARGNPSIWPERETVGSDTYPIGPQIYFDATASAMAAETQSPLVQRALELAESAKLVAAGNIDVEIAMRAMRTTGGRFVYERTTYGELSVTVRGILNNASGWAWSGFEDWGRVDGAGVITRAVDLANRSANPVAVEPGRYTVILEPAAVAALMEPLLPWWPAGLADAGITPYAKDPVGTNKINMQMIDRRLGMVASPFDPDRPSSTIGPDLRMPAVGPVIWFEKGVLKNLAYDPEYAKARGRRSVENPGGLRLTTEGAPTSLEDMIASTKRGLWVNRLSHVTPMNIRTGLLSGTTRDGTFLIENGKITKPVKNLRFTESPFFIFNKLDAWGTAVRASRNTVMPRVMVHDFDFTSLTDAV